MFQIDISCFLFDSQMFLFDHFYLIAYLHCWRRTRVQTLIKIRNLMATLNYAEYAHIAQTQNQTPSPCFCTGQES